MITLLQVHYKIKELSKAHAAVSIDSVLQAFNNSPEVIGYLETLLDLNFIEFLYNERAEIRLTMHGERTNQP